MSEEKKISYFVHEGIMAKMERTQSRLWIFSLIMFAAFVISNALWVIKFVCQG